MDNLRKHILVALITIKKDGPIESHVGICANLEYVLNVAGYEYSRSRFEDVLESLFRSWPDKSTMSAYPVGNWCDPREIFWSHFDSASNMWNKNTKYGAARYDLLNHCIAELQKQSR